MAIKGTKKTKLSIESILSLISQYDIYRYYMPTKDWELNRPTKSPFAEDKHPSFVIGNKYGEISHIAFNNTEYRGDCFDFVSQLYGISVTDALKRVDEDFGLGLGNSAQGNYKAIIEAYKQPEITKRTCLIQATTRRFTKEELAYWALYHQDLTDLQANDVYSIKDLYFNKQKFPLRDTELRFGYFYEGFWKIYRPFNVKKEKWMPNNTPIHIMDGRKNIQNCNVAFINKSKKDHMVVSKVFSCSCAVQNEGVACFTNENVNYLRANSKRQILSFDSDVTGVANSQQITKLFGFDYCNVPRKYLVEGIKDWADLAKAHGLKTVENVLKEKGII